MIWNKKIKRIAIIGLGLIGGSLATVLNKKYEVIGISRSKDTIKKALQQKIINEGFLDLNKNILSNVDLIFICTPLSLITKKIKELSKILDHEIIVTDVGSTKNEICKTAKKNMPPNVTFIGGHPMAGNEFSGIDYADETLFKNAVWVLTPFLNDKKSRSKIKKLESVIKNTGAKILISDPEEHDKAAALISHLPILIASSLCNLLIGIKNKKLKALAMKLAANGFRDTTRIAGGNPELNLDLTSLNSTEVNKLISKYCAEITRLGNLAKNKKRKKLLSEFVKISNWRRELYRFHARNANLL